MLVLVAVPVSSTMRRFNLITFVTCSLDLGSIRAVVKKYKDKLRTKLC